MSTENDPIRLELMKHVERAVRPVIAPMRRKMQMRRELLSHLTEVYEQELQASRVSQDALSRAVERLGGPAELTAQLQASIPRWHRWAAILNNAWNRHETETTIRYALRTALTAGVWSLVYMLFAVVIIEGISILAPAKIVNPLALGRIYIVVTIATTVGGFLMAILGQAVLRTLQRDHPRQALALATLAGPAMFLLVAAAVSTIAGNPRLAFTEFPALYFLWLVAPLILLGTSLLVERERRTESQWSGPALNM